MRQINYQGELKQYSRNLRQNGTLGEVLLWEHLRRKQMRGYLFNRQKPLKNFIADFYCRHLNLIIEIDGSSHMHERVQAKDFNREKALRELGLSVLRFNETEVRNQIDSVLEKIETWIIEKESGENKTAQQKSSFKEDAGGF